MMLHINFERYLTKTEEYQKHFPNNFENNVVQLLYSVWTKKKLYISKLIFLCPNHLWFFINGRQTRTSVLDCNNIAFHVDGMDEIN